MRQRREPRRRRVLLIGLLVAAGFAVLVGLRLVSLAGDLDDARASIDAAATALEDGRFADARSQLAVAEDLLIGANRDLYSAPDLQLLAALPVGRQNVVALRDTVAVALELTSGGLELLEGVQPLESADGRLEVSLSEGSVPLDVVTGAEDDLAELASALAVPPGFGDRSPLVLGTITDAQRRVAAEVDRRRPQVTNLAAGLAMLQELLGGNGDRRYLIAVANTAEMRGSGGMYLSYGVVESSGGELSLGEFGGIDELFLTEGVDPASLGVPADELARWNGLEPTRLWRNVNLVPDFRVVAPRAMAMFEAATGLPVDGVVQIDPAGLGAILAGVGPVDVPQAGLVSADNVVALTLNEAYSRFPDRDQRQEVLGDVAEAAFDRLVDGDFPSLRPLAEALATAVDERHVLFDSRQPSAADSIAFFGTDGELTSPEVTDHFLLTTQNRGRDKLDYYLDTRVVATGERDEQVSGELTIQVEVTNTAPAGVSEPEYVFGGDVAGEVALGTYTGIFSLYVPNGTTVVAGPDGAGSRVIREDGRSVLGWDAAIAAGETATFTFELALPPRPDGPYELFLDVVPRVRPTSWDVSISDGAGGSIERTGPLVVREALRSDAERGGG